MYLSNPSFTIVIENLSEDYFNFLMIGENCAISIEEILASCNDQNIKVAGGIFPGVIYDKINADDGLVIKRYNKNINFKLFKDFSKVELSDIPNYSVEDKSAILLVDGLANGISRFLEKLYEKYWNNLKFIGSGCGSLSLVQKPSVFCNEGFFQDAAIILYLSNKINLGVNHGWKKIAGPYVVSDSYNNSIYELNWVTAFDVYKEALKNYDGTEVTIENFFKIANAFPFGIQRDGMEDVVRDPIITDGKKLTCIGEVPQNIVVNILNGDKNQLLVGAKKAADEAFNHSNYTDVLVMDCVSRVLFQEKEFYRELTIIIDAISYQKNTFPLEGVLSLGEISSYGEGFLEFFNKTIVIGAYD